MNKVADYGMPQAVDDTVSNYTENKQNTHIPNSVDLTSPADYRVYGNDPTYWDFAKYSVPGYVGDAAVMAARGVAKFPIELSRLGMSAANIGYNKTIRPALKYPEMLARQMLTGKKHSPTTDRLTSAVNRGTAKVHDLADNTEQALNDYWVPNNPGMHNNISEFTGGLLVPIANISKAKSAATVAFKAVNPLAHANVASYIAKQVAPRVYKSFPSGRNVTRPVLNWTTRFAKRWDKWGKPVAVGSSIAPFADAALGITVPRFNDSSVMSSFRDGARALRDVSGFSTMGGVLNMLHSNQNAARTAMQTNIVRSILPTAKTTLIDNNPEGIAAAKQVAGQEVKQLPKDLVAWYNEPSDINWDKFTKSLKAVGKNIYQGAQKGIPEIKQAANRMKDTVTNVSNPQFANWLLKIKGMQQIPFIPKPKHSAPATTYKKPFIPKPGVTASDLIRRVIPGVSGFFAGNITGAIQDPSFFNSNAIKSFRNWYRRNQTDKYNNGFKIGSMDYLKNLFGIRNQEPANNTK